MSELTNNLHEINERLTVNKLVSLYVDLEELRSDKLNVITAIESCGITDELILMVGEDLRDLAPEFYEGNCDVTVEKLNASMASVGQAMKTVFARLIRIIIDMVMRHDKINSSLLKGIDKKHRKIKASDSLMWKDDRVIVQRPILSNVDSDLELINDRAEEILGVINQIDSQSDADVFDATIDRLMFGATASTDTKEMIDTLFQPIINSTKVVKDVDLFNMSTDGFVKTLHLSLPTWKNRVRKASVLRRKVRYGGKTNWSVTYSSDVTPVYIMSKLFEVASAINTAIGDDLRAIDRLYDNIHVTSTNSTEKEKR